MKTLLLSIAVFALGALSASASEDAQDKAPTVTKEATASAKGSLDNKSAVKEKPYLVFCTGNCSRTFRKHGEYETVSDAMRVVREYQGKDIQRFWIATGDESLAIGLLRGSERMPVEGCSVYAFSPRCGCRLQAKTNTVKEAEAEVAKLNRAVWAPAIVYHLK